MVGLLEDKKILAIDDTRSIRTFLRILLESNGAEFYEAETAQQGLQQCKENNPDLIVLDLGLPDKDGLDLLPELRAVMKKQAPPIIILSVRKDSQTKETAFERGADDYLSKPFTVEELLTVIEGQFED